MRKDEIPQGGGQGLRARESARHLGRDADAVRAGPEVDEAGWRANVRHWYRDLGIRGLFVNGKQGEFSSMTLAERRRAAEIAVEEAGADRSVMVSCSDQSLDTVIELAKHAQKIGAEYIIVHTPLLYFGAHTSDTLFEYYRHIAEQVEIGVALWNQPPDCGYTLEPEVCLRIAELPNIVAIKYSVARELYSKLTRMAGDKLIVSTSNEEEWLDNILELGWKLYLCSAPPFLLQTKADRRMHEYTELAFKRRSAARACGAEIARSGEAGIEGLAPGRQGGRAAEILAGAARAGRRPRAPAAARARRAREGGRARRVRRLRPAEAMIRGRIEDDRLLTGRGRYAADWHAAGEVHAAFLRSDRAHAQIGAIDVSGALAAPGVLGVLRGADLLAAGARSLPTRLAISGRDGKALIRPPRYALAHEKVRFVGEPLAVVVAETAAQAQDALELIGVDYSELPVVTSAEAALRPGAPQLHAEAPGNSVFDYASGDEAATEAAFSAAHRVVRLALDNTRVIGNPMEPRSFLACFDAARGHFTVHSPTQGLNNLREQLRAAMGLEEGRITAIAEDVGGGFGLRSNAYPEYIAVMAAARALGRPVSGAASRSETFLADDQARDVASVGELALDRDGRFLAMRFSFLVNLGAYLTQTGPMISTQGGHGLPHGRLRRARRARPHPARPHQHRAHCAYRGAGRPIMSYMVERLVDQAAAELGVDPAELRRRNLVRREPSPTAPRTARATTAATSRAAWTRRWPPPTGTASPREGRKPPRAARCAGAASPPISRLPARATCQRPGGAALRRGRRHHAARRCRIRRARATRPASRRSWGACSACRSRARSRCACCDPAVPLVGNSTGGSRTCVGVGSALALASRKVIEAGMPHAAEHLEAAAADIEFVEGAYRIKGTDRALALAELARKLAAQGAPHPLDVRAELSTGATFPNGCHVAEVEIDPETGEAAIRQLCGGGRRRQPHPPADRRRADDGRPHAGRGPGVRRARHLRPRDRPAALGQLHGLPDAARRAGRRPASSRTTRCPPPAICSGRRASARPASPARCPP